MKPLCLVGASLQLIINNYIVTLNAALRHVAASDGLALIDFATIAQQLPAAHLWIRDGMHPHPKLSSIVVMNLLLNEYERRTGSTAVK
jgi:hypothetical protein